jgi:hypothetical protein
MAPPQIQSHRRIKKEEGRRKKEEGRRKKEEGRRKKEEGRILVTRLCLVTQIQRLCLAIPKNSLKSNNPTSNNPTSKID